MRNQLSNVAHASRAIHIACAPAGLAQALQTALCLLTGSGRSRDLSLATSMALPCHHKPQRLIMPALLSFPLMAEHPNQSPSQSAVHLDAAAWLTLADPPAGAAILTLMCPCMAAGRRLLP